MKPTSSALAVLLLVAGSAFGQPKAGDVQPDQILFGTVYTGATVEASFMVFEPAKDINVKLEVTAPKFVKVVNKRIERHDYGPGKNFACGCVEIALDTAAPGERSGEVTVTVGQTTVKVPVKALVKARRPGLPRLLVVETPFQQYATKDGKAFNTWTGLVKDALDVSSLLVTRGKPVFRDLDLSKFDSVFVAESGLIDLSPADVKKVRAYAEAGGRVLVATNYFFRGSVPKANEVLAGYGLEMQDDEARVMAQNDITLGKDDLAAEVVKAGVGSLHFFRASPVRVTDQKRGRVLANAAGVGQAGDGFVAIGRAGKGKVIAIGESLWWNWITPEQAAGADNAKLLRWLLLPPKGA
jgi:hypothetical protein